MPPPDSGRPSSDDPELDPKILAFLAPLDGLAPATIHHSRGGDRRNAGRTGMRPARRRPIVVVPLVIVIGSGSALAIARVISNSTTLAPTGRTKIQNERSHASWAECQKIQGTTAKHAERVFARHGYRVEWRLTGAGGATTILPHPSEREVVFAIVPREPASKALFVTTRLRSDPLSRTPVMPGLPC
jgi:hypothetical protein